MLIYFCTCGPSHENQWEICKCYAKFVTCFSFPQKSISFTPFLYQRLRTTYQQIQCKSKINLPNPLESSGIYTRVFRKWQHFANAHGRRKPPTGLQRSQGKSRSEGGSQLGARSWDGSVPPAQPWGCSWWEKAAGCAHSNPC